MLCDKTILVTGGTGSFGKAFVKRVLKGQEPKKVIVFSRDELKQWELQQEIQDDRLRCFLGDVRDRDRLNRAFSGVDIVVHAAALKQVPAGEYNPFEFVKTNTIGSMNVAEAAIDSGVDRVLLLSTDKAVGAVNNYGATKLCAERLFVAANAYSGDHRTKLSVTRWGNVVGSRGSVLPLFLARRGQEVTITDERMDRFWITLDQAVEFVIQCLGWMQGGEIFIPKSPSVKIVDIAKALGCTYRITGIRPGEKLHESLICEEESRDARDCGSYYSIYGFSSGAGYSGGVDKTAENVPEGFRYTSDTNTEWLGPEELKRLVAPDS